jgi:hypothetical protein
MDCSRGLRTPRSAWNRSLVLAASVLALSSCSERKRLIEFGWDQPDTSFLRQHIVLMEQTPFDGCVFGVRYGSRPEGGSFTWDAWGRRAFAAQELEGALADLRATRLRRFKHNFLRLNVTPGDLDWFDDYSAIVQNAGLAARLAHEGRARGLLLDVEQYQGRLFDFQSQRDAKTKGWDAYAAQARRRGREIMGALQENHPGLTVFLTFGHSLPWHYTKEGKKTLAEVEYGLLAPFLDGLLDSAHGKTEIVDGYELSYGFTIPARFDQARGVVKERAPVIAADPARYQRHMRVAFGLWLDYQHQTRPWHVKEVERNHFTPANFERVLKRALAVSDRYVWVYTETPRWWQERQALPQPYVDVLWRARGERPAS